MHPGPGKAKRLIVADIASPGLRYGVDQLPKRRFARLLQSRVFAIHAIRVKHEFEDRGIAQGESHITAADAFERFWSGRAATLLTHEQGQPVKTSGRDFAEKSGDIAEMMPGGAVSDTRPARAFAQ